MDTISKDHIEMIVSLAIALDEAGGSISFMKAISSMTVIELIAVLAQNNIRFVYEKK